MTAPTNAARLHHHSPRRADLTQGPVTGHLIRLALPMTWGMMAIISFQLVDTLFVARLGTKALAAISFTFPVTYALFCLTLGMGIATSSVLSRQIGRGNPARVRRLTTHALLLAFIMGLACTAIGLVFTDHLFLMMGAPHDLMPLIHDFMIVWFAGNVFINTPLVTNAAMRAAGDARTPALIMTLAALINVALDPVLIFGLFGCPPLGIKGAALATTIANIGAMATALYIIALRKKMLTRSRRHWRLLGDSVRRFAFIAIPAGITSLLQPIAGAVITMLLARSSTEAVAAFGIVTRIEAFAFIVIMGLASGMAPLIGQSWGARLYGRVRQVLRRALIFASLWSLLAGILLAWLGRPVARAFSADPAIIDMTAFYFRAVGLTYVFGNLVPGWSSAFNAMGLPQRAFLMIFVRLVVINIPLALLASRLYGAHGVFLAVGFTNIVAGLLFHTTSRVFMRKQPP